MHRFKRSLENRGDLLEPHAEETARLMTMLSHSCHSNDNKAAKLALFTPSASLGFKVEGIK